MSSAAIEKSKIKLLNTIIRLGPSGAGWSKRNSEVILGGQQGKIVFNASIVDLAKSDGLITVDEKTIAITSAGKSKVRRHLCDHDPFGSQHRQLRSTSIVNQNSVVAATENCAGSPLARLYCRKQKDGSRFIANEEYQAGERLRRDFEKSRLQPSLSVRWKEGTSTGSKSRSRNNGFDLSDVAIDARRRLEDAINAMGPELAGVTLDICCFLKGFEIVERERGWPSRSAKLMLKTALSKLARHYGLTMPAKFTTGEGHIGQWGTADYRPTL